MVRVSSPAKLRPWSELTAKMVMGVVPGLVTQFGSVRLRFGDGTVQAVPVFVLAVPLQKGFSVFPLSFPSLFFLEFLVFFSSRGCPVFLSVFPFFSRDFRGSVGIKNPCFFGGFSLPFPKKNKERKDRVSTV